MAERKIMQLQAQEIFDIAMSEQIGPKGIFEPSVSLAKKCCRSASELRCRKFPGLVAALSFVPPCRYVWGVVLVARAQRVLTDRNHA